MGTILSILPSRFYDEDDASVMFIPKTQQVFYQNPDGTLQNGRIEFSNATGSNCGCGCSEKKFSNAIVVKKRKIFKNCCNK